MIRRRARTAYEEYYKDCSGKGCFAHNNDVDLWKDLKSNDGASYYCQKCWERYEDVTCPFDSRTQQLVKAILFGVPDVADHHFRHGAPLSTAVCVEGFHKVVTSDKKCTIMITPLAAVILAGGDIDRYLKAGADWTTPVTCLTCPATGCLNGVHGKTPAELMKQHLPHEVEDFLLLAGNKRQRRTTPVKVRAANLGIELPATPHGLRKALDSEDGAEKLEAKRQMQRHQKACQQKVDRAERKYESQRNPYAAELEDRRRALGNQAWCRSYEKNKEKWAAAAAANRSCQLLSKEVDPYFLRKEHF